MVQLRFLLRAVRWCTCLSEMNKDIVSLEGSSALLVCLLERYCIFGFSFVKHGEYVHRHNSDSCMCCIWG
jgi:hypothetical protein